MKFQAELIKAHRRKVGLSQGDLAKALNLSNGQFISNVERGRAHIPARMVQPLSKLLKVKVEMFVCCHLDDVEIQFREAVKGDQS